MSLRLNGFFIMKGFNLIRKPNKQVICGQNTETFVYFAGYYSMATSAELGKEKISKLLIRQSVPAAIGFMVMSVYTIVDTIFVGQFVGANAIGAVSVVSPISFLNRSGLSLTPSAKLSLILSNKGVGCS